jgi:succinyl-diaminopimelate desuccinylase
MLKEELRNAAQKEVEGAIADIRRLVAIPSVRGASEGGMPFGPGPAKALGEALAIAEGLGFRTKSLDGYCGYACFGEGEEKIGILAHVDVVPAGEGWSHPPFGGEIEGGKLYGRGVSDDKGPLVLAMRAMKILKDLGVSPKKEIRLVIGAAEETGMECVKRYREAEGDHFSMGFSPDAAFPPIFGEKGAYRAKFSRALENAGEVKIVSIQAGEAVNAVCAQARCVLEGPRERLEGIHRSFRAFAEGNAPESSASLDGDRLSLAAVGHAAHASMPELGLNAISLLFGFLSGVVHEPFFDAYNALVGHSYDGKALGIAASDQYGALTFVSGMAETRGGKAAATIDVRFPVTSHFDPSPLEKAFARYGVEVTGGEVSPPLFVDPKAPFVQALSRAYADCTGFEAEPVSIGGGTYARAFSNIVAFGAEFPGTDNCIHTKDEFMSLEAMGKAIEIYAAALLALLGI